MDQMIEKTIDQYRINGVLKKGEFWAVLEATDIQLDVPVAIKLMNPKLSKDPQFLKRFQQEARKQARLLHPNIIRILALRESTYGLLIVTEFVEGETLAERIRRDGSLRWADAEPLIEQSLSAICYAHSMDVPHLELKPGNILIQADGTPKITDFGIAWIRELSHSPHAGLDSHRKIYMSPEQLAAQPQVNLLSDIYSMGLTFYETLCGRLPFENIVSLEDIHKVLSARDFPAPHEMNPDVPIAVSEMVVKSMSWEAAQRYQSAQEMLDVLQASRKARKKGEAAAEAEGAGGQTRETDDEHSIEELLKRRQKIDRLIAEQYTRSLAVMFTDVVGSTSFFERRGDVEGRAMIQRYSSLLHPVIEKNHGKLIKMIGDGILASFDIAADAARCGMEMQRVLQSDNQKQLEMDRIAIRVALHFGTAVIEKGDIFGDVVNVASRVEHHAKSGEVLCSEAFYNQCKTKTQFSFVFSGKASMKGKAAEIPLYRLLWDEKEIEAVRQNPPPPPPAVPTGAQKAAANSVTLKQPFQLVVPKAAREKAEEETEGNPYHCSGPISDPRRFYGRKNEIGKIFSRCGASRPQSISLMGEPRIGKSSLLRSVAHPATRLQHLREPEKFIFVMIDLGIETRLDTGRFIEIILGGIAREYGPAMELNVDYSYDALNTVVSTLDREKYRLVLVLDNFECVTNNEGFDANFFSFCRSLANNYHLAYLVASGRNLQSLCHSREISDSPFFNIFSTLTLAPLSREEALELIVRPGARAGVDLSAHSDLILELGGYLPYYLQNACSLVFEHLRNRSSLERNARTRLSAAFLEKLQSDFQNIWNICNEEQRGVITLICEGTPVPSSQQYVVSDLLREGYLKEEGGNITLFSTAFQRYLESQGLVRKARRKFFFWRS